MKILATIIFILALPDAAAALSRFAPSRITLPSAEAVEFPRNVCRSLVTGVVCQDVQVTKPRQVTPAP